MCYLQTLYAKINNQIKQMESQDLSKPGVAHLRDLRRNLSLIEKELLTHG